MAAVSPFSSPSSPPSSSSLKSRTSINGIPRPPPSFLSVIPIRNAEKYKSGFKLFAGGDGLRRDEGENIKNGGAMKEPSAPGGDCSSAKSDRRPPPAFNLRWGDLLYPDQDNLGAVGLAGLLAWASVQVLFQLFVISLAILLAALKYSFIAALLLFILITLL